jgi:2-succinyl-6-hydroxy-2,4-cyclohexadiene-1-carboxylate synthase
MPFVRLNGIRLWYEEFGSGPTLILTHGFAGPGHPPIIEDFGERYRVVIYDVRGHGCTEAPAGPAAYSLPIFAADLAALMAHLGIDTAHIGGVSFGGMISAQFACDYPERLRSVLLCDTLAGNAKGDDPAAVEKERFVADAFSRMARIVEKYGVAELVRRENEHRHTADPYAIFSEMPLDEQDEKNALKERNMTDAGFVNAARAVVARPDLTSRTPQIRVPVLVSCGEWDLFYPCAVRDARIIPGSRFVTIRGAAHSTPDFRPLLWKRAVLDFLDDVEAGRPTAGVFELGETPAGAPAPSLPSLR